MSSVFSKIIQGEIPCYKIYEDERTLAFLDIAPEAEGHTLVVPKVEVDKVYDLEDEDYQAVMRTVKKVAQHMEKVLGKRVQIKVVGVDVPHAHVHVLPLTPDLLGPADQDTNPVENQGADSGDNREMASDDNQDAGEQSAGQRLHPSADELRAMQEKLKLD